MRSLFTGSMQGCCCEHWFMNTCMNTCQFRTRELDLISPYRLCVLVQASCKRTQQQRRA